MRKLLDVLKCISYIKWQNVKLELKTDSGVYQKILVMFQTVYITEKFNILNFIPPISQFFTSSPFLFVAFNLLSCYLYLSCCLSLQEYHQS